MLTNGREKRLILFSIWVFQALWSGGRAGWWFCFCLEVGGGGRSCPRLVCQQLLIRDTVPHLLVFLGPGSFLWWQLRLLSACGFVSHSVSDAVTSISTFEHKHTQIRCIHMLDVSLLVTVSKHVGKRNFLELKLPFSFKKNSKLSKFKFNCGPSCQRYALYGIANCRIVDINNAQFWSSRPHRMFWANGKQKATKGWQWIGYPRRGKAEGRDVQVPFKWRIMISFLSILSWHFPRVCGPKHWMLWKLHS